MKVIVFLLMAVVVGYLSGLMAESAVEGEYSKINSLATTGEFNETWIPFSLSQKINEFTATYGVLSSSMGFLGNAEMMDPAINAEIDFVIETARRSNGDGNYLVNRISECVFKADEDIITSCIICLLKNITGDIIAGGQTPVGPAYVSGTSISIPMTEFDTTHNLPVANPADITDVRIVHGVKVAICGEGEGCSAKFWKSNKKQWPSLYDPDDKFNDVFSTSITIKNKSDPTLKDALKAKGKTDEEFLAREATAALLNAEHVAVPYPLSPTEVIDMTSQALNTDTGIVILAEEFANLNEAGCLLEKCKCSGVTRLLLEYNNEDIVFEDVPVTITVHEKANEAPFATFTGKIPGDTIEVEPPDDKTKFKSNTIFKITGEDVDETIAIHTSCSRAIAVDQVYSDEDTSLTIKELDQLFKSAKGEVCPLAPLKCKGVEGMELQYFGSITPVTITVHEKANEAPFDTITGIITGGTFLVEPSNTKFKSNTIFKILDEDDNDAQIELATKHTSCSKPIAVGDLIGLSLEITALELVFE